MQQIEQSLNILSYLIVCIINFYNKTLYIVELTNCVVY